MLEFKQWLIERFKIERKRFDVSECMLIRKERWRTIQIRLKEVH